MLYLTYNIKINPDGMGAQYQRVVGIICISLYYNFQYVHTPIIKMDHIEDMKYLNNIDNFFQISNNYPNVDSIVYDNIFEESNPTIDDLNKYNINNKNILVKIYLPYNICDNNTIVYETGMQRLRNILIDKNLPFYKNNYKKIAIHIRRGDVKATVNENRYVPLDEIIKIINTFKKKYDNCSFYIFTQIDETNKNEFDIFNNDTMVQIKANEDILLTLNHLIHADILVLCKSSFSYLAGLYNNNTVYYFDFWHSKLSNWKNINELELIEKFTSSSIFNIMTNKILIYLYIFIIIVIIIWFIWKSRN